MYYFYFLKNEGKIEGKLWFSVPPLPIFYSVNDFIEATLTDTWQSLARASFHSFNVQSFFSLLSAFDCNFEHLFWFGQFYFFLMTLWLKLHLHPPSIIKRVWIVDQSCHYHFCIMFHSLEVACILLFISQLVLIFLSNCHLELFE